MDTLEAESYTRWARQVTIEAGGVRRSLNSFLTPLLTICERSEAKWSRKFSRVITRNQLNFVRHLTRALQESLVYLSYRAFSDISGGNVPRV